MSRNPDIQRLLANLRGGIIDSRDYQQAGTPEQDRQSSSGSSSRVNTSSTAQILQKTSQQTTIKPNTKHVGVSHTDTPSRTNTPTVADASNITTWPSAVKFISKHVVPDEKLEAKIKHLITDQHKHERDWWDKREMIVNRQTGRVGNQQKAAELLRSLGGQYVPVAPSDPEADVAELEAFDIKVHKSLTQLATHYDRELKQMGIPFFAIHHDLVNLGDDKERMNASTGQLDQGKLKELQKRMLIYLEELFGEESPPS